jgi:hypothetical protein
MLPSRRRLGLGEAWFVLALAVATLVHAPGLFSPLSMDDLAQAAMSRGEYPTAHDRYFGMYDFCDDANRKALVDAGALPWWTHPNLLLRFLRPLSSLSLYFDHRLFPNDPVWGHLHSMAWWALSIAAVHALLRRALGTRVARLATVIYAMAPCHVVPLVWLANRGALLSTALGVTALHFYVRWRDTWRSQDGAAACAIFSLAMLAGEYSVAFAAYAIAFEWVDRGYRYERRAWRALGISVCLVPTIVYLLAHRALGYGAHSGGWYHDPTWGLGPFLRGAWQRLEVLLAQGWLQVGLHTMAGLPDLLTAAALTGAGAVVSVLLCRALRDLDLEQRRNALWLLIGSLLSLGPCLTVEPSPQLLSAATVGISSSVALIVDRAWFPRAAEPRQGLAQLNEFVALGLAFLHVIVAPANARSATRTAAQDAATQMRAMSWIRKHLAKRTTVVLVRGESLPTVLWPPYMTADVQPVWRVLSYRAGRVRMLRTGERTIDLVASPGPIFPMGPRELFRDSDRPFHSGDVIEIAGMIATIVQVNDDGSARRVRFDFDRPLDDPSLLWIDEKFESFVEIKLPRPGYGEPEVP